MGGDIQLILFVQTQYAGGEPGAASPGTTASQAGKAARQRSNRSLAGSMAVSKWILGTFRVIAATAEQSRDIAENNQERL
jgi:hypothetical protein